MDTRITSDQILSYLLGDIEDPSERRRIEDACRGDPVIAARFEAIERALEQAVQEPEEVEPSAAALRFLRAARRHAEENAAAAGAATAALPPARERVGFSDWLKTAAAALLTGRISPEFQAQFAASEPVIAQEFHSPDGAIEALMRIGVAKRFMLQVRIKRSPAGDSPIACFRISEPQGGSVLARGFVALVPAGDHVEGEICLDMVNPELRGKSANCTLEVRLHHEPFTQEDAELLVKSANATEQTESQNVLVQAYRRLIGASE